jgi:hypothetical protein
VNCWCRLYPYIAVTHLTALGQMRAALLARVQSGFNLAAQHTAQHTVQCTATRANLTVRFVTKHTMVSATASAQQICRPQVSVWYVGIHNVPGSASFAAQSCTLLAAGAACSACQLRCTAAYMCTHLFPSHTLQALEPAAQRHPAAAGTCVSTYQAALHRRQAGLPESSHAIPAATQQHRLVVQLNAMYIERVVFLHTRDCWIAPQALGSCAVMSLMQPICALHISINRVLVVVHVNTSLLTQHRAGA